ncbi:MAG: hypothetical protein ACR2GZ_10900 [Solirubrobacteraceae bacterium]
MVGFESYVYDRVVEALRSIPLSDAEDAYVVSLLVYDEDDEPSRPTVMVSINTETVFREALASASSAEEARWNYAFWLQDPLGILFESLEDPDGALRRDEWIREARLQDSDQGPGGVTANFVVVLERTVALLHENGVVQSVFGRGIPVLFHELEYYEEIAEQNRRANPAGLADAFAAWVMGAD